MKYNFERIIWSRMIVKISVQANLILLLWECLGDPFNITSWLFSPCYWFQDPPESDLLIAKHVPDRYPLQVLKLHSWDSACLRIDLCAAINFIFIPFVRNCPVTRLTDYVEKNYQINDFALSLHVNVKLKENRYHIQIFYTITQISCII